MKVVFESTSPDTVIFETGPFYEVQFAGFIGGDNEAIQAQVDDLEIRVAELEAGSGSPVSVVYNETPSGLVNGSNATFTTLNEFVPGTVNVYAGVARLSLLDDFNTSGNSTITLFQSPLTGENIRVSYIKL